MGIKNIRFKIENIRNSYRQKLMGNETSQNSLEQSKQLKNYEEVSRTSEGVIYRQKIVIQGQQNSQYFILKEHNYHSQQSYQQNYKKYKQSLSSINEQQSNTLSIREVMKEQVQHFCSNTYKIYTLYEFPELTLKDEIEVRAKENKFFEECEIVAILQTCVLALEEIRAVICFGTKCIFISPDGVIKVTHSDLVDENYRHVINARAYYAPEKLTNFMNQSTSETALKKQIIFSMGMTLLEACTLEEVYDIYNYDSQTINQTKLSAKIESLAQRYSNEMIELISNMLELNPNRRISILEVQRALNKFDQIQDQRLDQQDFVDQEKEELETKCDKFFINDGNTLPKIKESTESNEEPSVPNLLSHQNSSRMSLNNNKNYQSKGIPAEPFYQNIEKSMENYKITCNLARKSTHSIAPNTQSVQFQQIQHTPIAPSANQTIFTDPRLMEIIRKDLQEISKSRTSRLMTSNHDQPNNSWVNTSQNVSQSNDTQRHFDCQIIKSQCNQYFDQSVNSRGFDGLVTLNNCPQVQSLAASVAYESSNKKTYVYQQSDVKRHPDDNSNYENESQMNMSVALSSKNFASNKKPYNQMNDTSTVRYPLRQMDLNQNPASSLSEVEAEIKAAMMKKKEANLIYLQEQYEDGVRYEGMSKNGLKQGYGKLIYNDGAYYEGYFQGDKINGKGILYYKKNCPAYDGEWLDEQFNGYGQLYNEQPEDLQEQFPFHNWNFLQNYWIKYEGEFLHDNKHGHGKIVLTTGEYIQGEFIDDMLNGWATFYKQNGDSIEGKWENNLLLQLKHD